MERDDNFKKHVTLTGGPLNRGFAVLLLMCGSGMSYIFASVFLFYYYYYYFYFFLVSHLCMQVYANLLIFIIIQRMNYK